MKNIKYIIAFLFASFIGIGCTEHDLAETPDDSTKKMIDEIVIKIKQPQSVTRSGWGQMDETKETSSAISVTYDNTNIQTRSDGLYTDWEIEATEIHDIWILFFTIDDFGAIVRCQYIDNIPPSITGPEGSEIEREYRIRLKTPILNDYSECYVMINTNNPDLLPFTIYLPIPDNEEALQDEGWRALVDAAIYKYSNSESVIKDNGEYQFQMTGKYYHDFVYVTPAVAKLNITVTNNTSEITIKSIQLKDVLKGTDLLSPFFKNNLSDYMPWPPLWKWGTEDFLTSEEMQGYYMNYDISEVDVGQNQSYTETFYVPEQYRGTGNNINSERDKIRENTPLYDIYNPDVFMMHIEIKGIWRRLGSEVPFTITIFPGEDIKVYNYNFNVLNSIIYNIKIKILSTNNNFVNDPRVDIGFPLN